MKIISNRFSLIFYCAMFNLLFEYSARGLREFIQRPLFMLCLFGIYFTYFAVLEDLIVRFRLRNFQIFLAGFLYGLIPAAFLTGNLFNRSIYGGFLVLGINVGTLIVIGIFAWGVVQGIVTLYLANRILTRDWDHPRMGKVGWSGVILYQLFMILIAAKNPVTPRGRPSGYFVLALLIIVAAALLIKSLRGSRPAIQLFQRSGVMDFLAFGSVILFLILGTFFISGEVVVTSQPLNKLAVRIENLWVFFCALVFFVYRFAKGSDVTV